MKRNPIIENIYQQLLNADNNFVKNASKACNMTEEEVIEASECLKILIENGDLK